MNMKKYNQNAYRCIGIWGRNLGSFPSYIKNEQRIAAEQGAPLTAIYARDGVWSTVEEIENIPLRNEIIRKLAEYAATQRIGE
jgi:hypothetical protein|tara:strand:+ start:460 stop:708 length:249 start_codon:yes stop_codon:yes gene_type:complete